MMPVVVLQGTISIGQPGMPQQAYTNASFPALQALVAANEAAFPWIIPQENVLLQHLLTPNVTYVFDSIPQLCNWARIMVVATDLMTVCLNGGAGGAGQWRARYLLVEAQRAAFQAAGNGPGQFTLVGCQYAVAAQPGVNHYYITRVGSPNSVLYAGHLTVADAKAILRQLANPAPGFVPNPVMADEFACSYLAEPTRWPQEQVFNLLALQAADVTVLTGQGRTLPMTSGTTYEPALGVLGREAPKRIVLFADQIGLTMVIAQELGLNGNLANFLTAMRGQYNAS
jgi:hypothetical protein